MKSRVFATVYLIGLLCHTAYAADVTPSPPPHPSKIPDVVATVNGHNITREDLERRMTQSRAMDPERFDAMDPEQRKKAIARTIGNMVVREVVYQAALKRKIVITDKDVDQKLKELKSQFPSEDAFHKTFADAQITIPAWRVETKKNIMAAKLEELMADELDVSDKEIIDYYEKNRKELTKDSTETLKDHRDHVRFILQRVKWQQERSVWLNGLLARVNVWKWSPE